MPFEVFAGGTVTGNFCVSVLTAGIDAGEISIVDYRASGQRCFATAEQAGWAGGGTPPCSQ